MDLGYLVRSARIVTFRCVKGVLCISKIKYSHPFELETETHLSFSDIDWRIAINRGM